MNLWPAFLGETKVGMIRQLAPLYIVKEEEEEEEEEDVSTQL